MKIIANSAFVPNFLLGAAGGIQYLKLKKASRDPRKSQEKCLRAILNYGKDTVFGKEHRFSYILEATNADELFKRYQEEVKATDYEDFRPYVNRMKNGESDVLFQGKPVLYATTSGSTGEKLYEGQFINAVNQASESTGLKLNYFAGYADLSESRYDFYYEFEDESVTQERAEAFTALVDENIKKMNIEYKAKRDSFRLHAPVTHRLVQNSFSQFKEYILGQTGQDASRFKPNVLAQNEEKHDAIKRFVIE